MPLTLTLVFFQIGSQCVSRFFSTTFIHFTGRCIFENGACFCGFITGGWGVPAQHQEEHGEGASPRVASGGDQVDKKVDVFCDDDPGLAGRVSGVNYFAFGIVGVVRKDHLRVLPGMFRALPSQAIEC